MHQHRLEISSRANRRAERRERIRYFGFAGVVGLLLVLNLVGVLRTVWGVDTAAVLTIVAGYRTFTNAIRGLLERTISADLAIAIAVVAALSAGEYLAAAEAMFIMLVGEGLEGYAAKRTSRAIEQFVERMPRKARKLVGEEELEVEAGALAPGDVMVVRGGERIAADGKVIAGVSAVDESTITGEALPRDKQVGDEVFSGTLNGHGRLLVEVTRAGEETTLARVIKLVEEAKEKRAPVERLADRYAKYFVPLLLAAGAGTFYFTRDWMRTVAVLIVGCPCALILATPTAMVAAIGGLARRGILVRGGKVLEAAAKADTIVFDKTGTVTEGRFEVLAVVSLNGGKEEAVLGLAAAAEAGSDHLLARVIVAEARHRKVAIPAVESARILPGRGAEARRGGKVIRVGNAAYLSEHGIRGASALVEEADRFGATVVLVAEEEHLWGGILLRDRVRAGVKQATKALEELGLTRQVMLTGDRRRAAEVMAREAGIGEVEAELLPEEKLERVRRLTREGRLVAMVGDGVNDAPALAAAQVGIAVSGASDITAEAADVVYMGRSLEQLPQLFAVSRRAVATAWQNIIGFALIVNVVAIGLASSGKMGPLGAAITHQIASFLVMLNSLRLLGGERAAAGWRAKVEAAWRRGKWWWERQAPLEWLEEQWEERRRYYKGAMYAGLAGVVLNGFYVLEPEETGVIERFGRKQSPLKEPGLHYKLPWPVERLWRVETRRVRVVEVGFRTESKEAAGREPLAYEWNAQHRTGRFARRPEESLMLSGDQNLTELTATVHYRIGRPEEYVFEHVDAEATLRAATEATIQEVVTTTGLDDALTGKRREMERRIAAGLQARAERYRTGVEILAVRLLDVHPPVEVVEAYREVSGAYEEKSRLINEAEGYRNEQVALARGRAAARRVGAEGYRLGRVNRADGEAARFREAEGAYRMGQATTELRLYLETMEEVLPGKQKVIVDSTGGRRHLLLNEDSVEVAPLVAPMNEERKR